MPSLIHLEDMSHYATAISAQKSVKPLHLKFS